MLISPLFPEAASDWTAFYDFRLLKRSKRSRKALIASRHSFNRYKKTAELTPCVFVRPSVKIAKNADCIFGVWDVESFLLRGF